MAKTYNHLRAISLKQSKFNDDGKRVAIVDGSDEIVILYNENKIDKNNLVENIKSGNLNFMKKVLCVNKMMAEQLAD